MRIMLGIIVGIIGGFVLGIALSSFIGIFGMVFFNQSMGIKFLPYFTSFICAIAVPIIDHKSSKVKTVQ
jgi:hypothetical protein